MKDLVYVASINDELLFTDLQECVEFICDNSENPLTKSIDVFYKLQPTHSSFVRSKDIIESIQNRAYDEYSEFSENYLDDIYFDQSKINSLDTLITNWLNENSEQPSFYQANEFIKTIDVTNELLSQYNLLD